MLYFPVEEIRDPSAKWSVAAVHNDALPTEKWNPQQSIEFLSYFFPILGPTRALCPVRSTTDGNCCVFPFVYQGKQHNYCTGVDGQDLWCQTSSVNKQGQMSGSCDRKW